MAPLATIFPTDSGKQALRSLPPSHVVRSGRLCERACPSVCSRHQNLDHNTEKSQVSSGRPLPVTCLPIAKTKVLLMITK